MVSQDIEAFEHKSSVIFPESYKRFLFFNNGGKPVKRRFKTQDGTITSSVMLFLPLSKEIESNLESFYEKYCINKIVPSNLIPIGVDSHDNLICIEISDQDKVYFCDMDYFEEDNGLKDDCIKLISNNFLLFLNDLYST